ncbi:hypothetical protein PRZ48_014107 [Zasmidium cellare]|uniref:Sulfotransferase n=1 Tax=Zasmidium cellare TaxID=395010 RepID=A0ABR0E0I3_ZASCE|nr:hypothetical protein PRZ48_014107 [Zasmidium cellare]
MPRTGTASMQAALQILGYNKTHHGFILVDQPLTSNAWEAAVNAKFSGAKPACSKETFDAFFEGYLATTDTPSAFFTEELLEFYPDAKFILVERNLTPWLKSFRVLMEGMFGPKGIFVLAIDRILGYASLRTYRKLYSAYFGANTAERIMMNAPRVYKEHYRRVRELVPKERLLNYELGSGWEPLCEFLGKEVPSVEFPWINETKALEAKMVSVMAARARELVWVLSWWFGGLGVAVAGVWVMMR